MHFAVLGSEDQGELQVRCWVVSHHTLWRRIQIWSMIFSREAQPHLLLLPLAPHLPPTLTLCPGLEPKTEEEVVILNNLSA